jgi:hypothetical protein
MTAVLKIIKDPVVQYNHGSQIFEKKFQIPTSYKTTGSCSILEGF